MTDTIENTRVMYEPSANSGQFVKTSTTNPCHSENKVLFVGSIWMRNSFMHFPETMKSTVNLTRQENHVYMIITVITLQGYIVLSVCSLY